MRPRFEELAWRSTPIGELTLRRRVEPALGVALGVDVYEVKLGEEFLMSSLFTVAEEELARAWPWPSSTNRPSTSSSVAWAWDTPREPRWQTPGCDR